MPNGNFHEMTDREILVRVATELDYMKEKLKETNQSMHEHVEALRIGWNDCNESHCRVEKEMGIRIENVEKKIWTVSTVFASFVFCLHL